MWLAVRLIWANCVLLLSRASTSPATASGASVTRKVMGRRALVMLSSLRTPLSLLASSSRLRGAWGTCRSMVISTGSLAALRLPAMSMAWARSRCSPAPRAMPLNTKLPLLSANTSNSSSPGLRLPLLLRSSNKNTRAPGSVVPAKLRPVAVRVSPSSVDTPVSRLAPRASEGFSALVSMVILRSDAVPSLPAASTPTTRSVCRPSDSGDAPVLNTKVPLGGKLSPLRVPSKVVRVPNSRPLKAATP